MDQDTGLADPTSELSVPQSQRTGVRQHLAAIAILLLITAGLFAWTVQLRAPWFGTLSTAPFYHQWLSGCTLKWSKNWYREGVFHDRFSLLENPPSIEFPTIESRVPYVSYPPGCVLPVYLLSCAMRQEPTVAMVMGWNLASHFLIAVLLGLIAYVALFRAGMSPWNALAFSISAPCLELFFPAPFYNHQNVYAMDMAVILPFVAALLLETLRSAAPKGRWLFAIDVLLWCALFVGYLTDWLMVFVGITIYVKRLVLGEVAHSSFGAFLKDSAVYWSSAALAGACFVAQVSWLDGWETLYARYQLRTGIDLTKAEFLPPTLREYFHVFLPNAFGPGGQWLFLGGLGFFLALLAREAFRKWRGLSDGPALGGLVVVMCLAMIPCLVQLRVFKQHAWHPFSTVKFSVFLSLVPFCIAPAAIALLMAKRWGAAGRVVLQVLAVSCSIALVYASERARTLQFPSPTPFFQELAKAFSSAGIGYRDVVVSSQFEIPANPPQAVATTMKRVYCCPEQSDLM